jgi:hypothetical protein
MKHKKLNVPRLNERNVRWTCTEGEVYTTMNTSDVYRELEKVEAYTFYSIKELIEDHLNGLKISNDAKKSIVKAVNSYKPEFSIPIPHPWDR